MKEINKAKKLLDKYYKSKDKDIESQLISYVMRWEMEMFDRKMNDRNFKPNNEDEYQEKREVMKMIRKDLNLIVKDYNQNPPDNIVEIRKDIERMCMNTKN